VTVEPEALELCELKPEDASLSWRSFCADKCNPPPVKFMRAPLAALARQPGAAAAPPPVSRGAARAEPAPAPPPPPPSSASSSGLAPRPAPAIPGPPPGKNTHAGA